jgi:hypothetical protein
MKRNLKPLTDRGLERRPERDNGGRGRSVEAAPLRVGKFASSTSN